MNENRTLCIAAGKAETEEKIIAAAGNTGVASADSLKSRKVDMKDYVLNKKPEPASNEIVWAFDLGHPLRLEQDSSLAGAGEDVRRTGEGRWGETIQCGADRGEVSNPGHQKTAVRRGNEVGASLLIPAEFGETKTAAGRRRMWRTRQAQSSPGFAVAHLNCNSRLDAN